MNMRYKLLLGILAVLLAVGGYFFYEVFYGPNDFAGGTEKTFYVSRGQTFASVVDSLETGGIIRNRELFVFVAKMFGGTTRIQVGKYIFGTGISNVDLFLALREGKHAALIPVTIPEGLRPRAQARILAHTLGIDSARFVQLAYDESFTHSLGINAHSLEGYLLPETYSFYWQVDEAEVIKRMVDQFHHFYNDSLQAKANALAWTTNQVLTLASIVEGEAVLASERVVISGVYHNRLRKGMRLEADPTIQYMIEDGPRRVLYSDLRMDNPYNTYRIKGLPPGPVNNPGKASILAALFPSNHNYLFFVANGEGEHWFSTNYTDHLRNVWKYRRNRARQLQSLTQTKDRKEQRPN
jgi:UPF0755 protein